MDRNLIDHSLAAIGTKHGFDSDVVSGTRFGYVGSGAVQAGGAAVADEVEIKLHAANVRHAVRIVINTAEAVAEGEGRQHRGRLSAISRGEHILNSNGRISPNV